MEVVVGIIESVGVLNTRTLYNEDLQMVLKYLSAKFHSYSNARDAELRRNLGHFCEAEQHKKVNSIDCHDHTN